MGDLEQKSRRRTRSANLQKVVLYSVAAAGVLAIGMLAPNVLVAMDKIGLIPKRRQKEYISSAAGVLKRKGLLKFNGKHYELTPAGRKLLSRWVFANYKLRKPQKWDGKWRVFIYDIPHKKKKIRDYIASIFRRAGFERIQDSVWIFPYDCEDVIGLLKTDLRVGKNILYMIVEEFENDKYLREIFKLR
ncbi:MAG: hypothetical protein A2758_02895 [Candidatus Zambryskibacteria bacterium RIFCSPHIGHO2_01_FULL_49_18]|uniref:Transcriptional repressor PaaX-like central Cas2-like domain-containing protein n=2 Tax=Candidatus Zambryskiibacteriota TaxID=1817925 RepID=A0A1G2T457_9BACT|nr:MAG: hypothetical protein A2758_02895 [Candidatus Zambryskibacteria bacterium RIFCSPHIGHO2_01_FULL_49_18]OHB05022.1 MAG: hypothetical protein A3A26_00390 [Candidatus Zambryskibacteria bacterium RIFCSPLOWO2_01_FULL_47_14]